MPGVKLHLESWHHYFLGKKDPRGATGGGHLFVMILKERAPLVYAFILREFDTEEDWTKHDPRLNPILEEWRSRRLKATSKKRRPSCRELAAFIIERAFAGAWEVWGIRPPHSAAQLNSFFRRYVHGHRGALQDFKRALKAGPPWPSHHVGHELRCFLGAPGGAAHRYGLLAPKPLDRPLKLHVVRLDDSTEE
jgi:hypothetical protein